jgi:hypothetical protein
MCEGLNNVFKAGFSTRKEMLFFIISVILFNFFYDKKPGTYVGVYMQYVIFSGYGLGSFASSLCL